jgi:hypothetical protein
MIFLHHGTGLLESSLMTATDFDYALAGLEVEVADVAVAACESQSSSKPLVSSITRHRSFAPETVERGMRGHAGLTQFGISGLA